jgi:hypothetical protein
LGVSAVAVGSYEGHHQGLAGDCGVIQSFEDSHPVAMFFIGFE